MALIDFLRKNDRRHNVLIRNSDGEDICYQPAGAYSRKRHPSIRTRDDFAVNLDTDVEDGASRVNRRRYPLVWEEYWQLLMDAEVIEVGQDVKEDLMILYLEPELYWNRENDKIYRIEDIRGLYREAQTEYPHRFGSYSFEEFYERAVNSNISFIVRIL